MQLTIAPKVSAGSFAYYKDGSARPAVHQDPYVCDLNGDGIDEVIFGGLETQPNTPAEFSPLTVHIFGWKNGVFQNLSDQWLPKGAGDIEGVGSICFADFSGDGLTDIFLSAYADMNDVFSPYVLMNRGGYFEKQALPETLAWQHGSATADLNADGFADVFATGYGTPTIYLGGPAGLTPYVFTNFAGGSAVALGDFLGDGTITAVISDFWQSGSDTELARIRLSQDSKSAILEELSLLPAPLLENLSTAKEESHDARIKAVDFNADGLLDVVVYSRLGFDGTQWPNVSAVQLMQNQGKGAFVDVTTDKLKGYVSASMIPYAPVIRDLNLDGLIDIYVDGASWKTTHNSASMLMQNSAGQFVDTARADLSRQVSANGGVSTVTMGPNDSLYLVTLDIQSGQGLVASQMVTFPDRQASENLQGTGVSDQVWGLGGNDRIEGMAGNDRIDGGEGVDIAIYKQNASQCTISRVSDGCQVVSAAEGTDVLLNVERIQFADKFLAIDVDGNAGQVAKALGAVFGKLSASNKEFVGIGLYYMDDLNFSYANLVQLAINARLGANPSSTQVVDLLYTNVVGAAPDALTRKSFTDLLDNHNLTIGSLGVLAAETDLNKTNIDLAGLAKVGLAYLPYSG